jgi:putative chitinase
LLSKPELLEQPEYAALSAALYWSSNELNELADAGKLEAITQRINGGQNGAADRLTIYQRALMILT